MIENKGYRRKTHSVYVGQVGVGSAFPIRIQSMLTSDTKDTDACIQEMLALCEAGCEIIRLTVPTVLDLKNLKNIRSEMKRLNIKAPLVADIHFTPSIALGVVEFVEKVRINPGNFVDKKLFIPKEYTDEEYTSELKHLHEKFIPLVLKCKELGVSMRVGTNHGSLSDRILNRYGDTPLGMAESALEFLRIAFEHNYHDIILSMKASNVGVMIEAYRVLNQKLIEEKLPAYPFHLGVTEAGMGADARIKSAIGIGTLLEEGLGDTIRVSLTEDSIFEIPVAYEIAAPYSLRCALSSKSKANAPAYPSKFSWNRSLVSQTIGPFKYGGTEPLRVWTRLPEDKSALEAALLNPDSGLEGLEVSCLKDLALVHSQIKNKSLALAFISDDPKELLQAKLAHKLCWRIQKPVSDQDLKAVLETCQALGSHLEIVWGKDFDETKLAATLSHLKKTWATFNFKNYLFSLIQKSANAAYLNLVRLLDQENLNPSIHLRFTGQSLLDTSVQMGGLLIDGIGNSLQIDWEGARLEESISSAYSILQACRLRMTKTEYIACPSCGRTQFNLQEVSQKIKEQTQHLKGVKIGIMGCIVNGPGEMADADFGYVGMGEGKISLYVGQTAVKKNIPQDKAVDELVALIRKEGRWVEPSAKAGST